MLYLLNTSAPCMYFEQTCRAHRTILDSIEHTLYVFYCILCRRCINTTDTAMEQRTPCFVVIASLRRVGFIHSYYSRDALLSIFSPIYLSFCAVHKSMLACKIRTGADATALARTLVKTCFVALYNSKIAFFSYQFNNGAQQIWRTKNMLCECVECERDHNRK